MAWHLDPAALLAYVLSRMPEELAGVLGHRYASLEALHRTVTGILETKLKPAKKRQAQWYLSFVERALDKLENAA